MRVKFILPALTEATSPVFRPIKYSLFPPLGLATLAAHLAPEDDAEIVDEHVERLRLGDDPDMVVIQAYITSARRSYEIADHYRGRRIFVAMGGLHPTSLPEEAARYADVVFTGPGDDTWPRFLADHRAGNHAPRYDSTIRTLVGAPADPAGSHQAPPVPRPLLEAAVACGLRSLFVGFETVNPANLTATRKYQNLHRDYDEAVSRLHGLGVMVNGSFVFGMDDDDGSVFGRTVDWGVRNGIETSTFHVLTPYPGTGLYQRMEADGRLLHRDWSRYDTRQVVFRPARLSPDELEQGYWWAYEEFYRWANIARGAATKESLRGRLRHAAYAGGWKKFEGMWNLLIRAGQVGRARSVLESVLLGSMSRRTRREALENNPPPGSGGAAGLYGGSRSAAGIDPLASGARTDQLVHRGVERR
jgi:radical SAM superfamily enzyme YgiQ (UPF0313 family)